MFRFSPSYVLSCFAFVCVCYGTAMSQETESSPSLLIVVFSPEVEDTKRLASQKIVWDNLVDGLKRQKVTQLNAINEVTLGSAADRSRAEEIAKVQGQRFTLYLEFAGYSSTFGKEVARTNQIEKLIAKYTLFSPGGKDVVGQGSVEQETAPDSRFETINNSKAITNNTGGVINRSGRQPSRISRPDESPQVAIDVTSLKRVGKVLSERVIKASKSYVIKL